MGQAANSVGGDLVYEDAFLPELSGQYLGGHLGMPDSEDHDVGLDPFKVDLDPFDADQTLGEEPGIFGFAT